MTDTLSPSLKTARIDAGAPAAVDTAGYWPSIDGLRTIAVGAVFIFHLNAEWLPGGFVGVDVFFVISGFLITTLLARDIEAGRFSVARFYQRRVARIVPLSLLVAAVTLAAGAILYSAQDFAFLGANTPAAAFSFYNFRMLFQGDYFKIQPEAQPFVHYWSLAVEEQFYLIFPFVLVGVMRWTRRPATVLLFLLLLSLAACVVITPGHKEFAFDMLPTRAWELLAGSALAFVRRSHLAFLRRHSAFFSAAGLALIVVSIGWTTNEGFPGWRAILPVAGAAFALAGVGGDDPFQRFLARKPMVYVGERSYALYLWHWPVFSFVDYSLFLWSPSARTALKVLVAGAATIVTHVAVENPLRVRFNRPGMGLRAFLICLATAGGLSAGGLYVRSAWYLSASEENLQTGGVTLNPAGRRRVAIIGDSQGAMYNYELSLLARKLDFRLDILSVAGRTLLKGEADSMWPGVENYIRDKSYDLAILTEAWFIKKPDDMRAALEATIAVLDGRARRILILGQPPLPKDAPIREALLSRKAVAFAEHDVFKPFRLDAEQTIARMANAKVAYLPIADAFLKEDGSIIAVAPDGKIAFQDDGLHISDSGTAMIRARLESALRAALDGR